MRVPTALVGMAFGMTLALPAQALNQRTWVSGKGADQDGCGPVAKPCRTLQFAHDQTQAGGEIDVLDPAGYGTVKINKSISIINDGVGVAGLFSSQGAQALSIESNQWISVLLRGLTIDGGRSNTAAIAFIANGRLSIQNCLIRNSGGFYAVADAPSSIEILNSAFSGNPQSIGIEQYGSGQAYGRPLTILIDRTIVTGNDLNAINLSKSGGNRMTFVISNSTVTSSGTGIMVGYGVEGIISNSTIAQNQFGVWGYSSSVTLADNTIFGNYDTGVNAREGMKSFGDNKISGNGTDVFGSLTPVSSR